MNNLFQIGDFVFVRVTETFDRMIVVGDSGLEDPESEILMLKFITSGVMDPNSLSYSYGLEFEFRGDRYRSRADGGTLTMLLSMNSLHLFLDYKVNKSAIF